MKFKKQLFIIFSSILFVSSTPAYSESQISPQDKIFLQKMESIQKSIQKGNVTIPNGIAELKLNDNIRYIPPNTTETMLVDFWGNPTGSGSKTQGMLIPKGVDITSEKSWGVVITYEEDGHVSDEDANKINYDDLMKQMKESTIAASKETNQNIELIGWAEKPSYDSSNHKMYWAKEIKFNGDSQNTLNYNVRILGRKGVLVLNAISGMNNLDNIRNSMKDILSFTNFTKGNTYNDYNSSTDKLAAYGLAALVAGTIATKTGLFAKLFVLLLAFKKVIILAVVALFGGIASIFSKKKEG